VASGDHREALTVCGNPKTQRAHGAELFDRRRNRPHECAELLNDVRASIWTHQPQKHFGLKSSIKSVLGLSV